MTGRRALLLGCGTFADPKLAPLRSPGRDVAELERVLVDARTCGYTVSSTVDCTAREAQRAIEAFFTAARPADPMNLLYLSCHGVQDRQGRLYFAFTDTEQDFLSSTAVSAEWVRECIGSSRSRATLVLVDCCFSGAFIKGMRARSSGANVESLVHDVPHGSGVTVLTASGETEASFEDATATDVRPSYFTHALISGIASGAADLNRDGRVTADELYDYVYDQVRQGPSPQRPRRLGVGEGFLVVADSAFAATPSPFTPGVERRGDVGAGSRVRRRSANRTVLRVCLWVATGLFLLGELAMIGATISGGYAETEGVPNPHEVADAVGANLFCGVPFVALCVFVVLDVRRARRGGLNRSDDAS